MLQSIKGYRTLLFGFMLGGLGFLQAVNWVDVVPAGWEGIATAAVGAMVMWLRTMTDTPVRQSS
jgi:hypothetical protein